MNTKNHPHTTHSLSDQRLCEWLVGTDLVSQNYQRGAIGAAAKTPLKKRLRWIMAPSKLSGFTVSNFHKEKERKRNDIDLCPNRYTLAFCCCFKAWGCFCS